MGRRSHALDTAAALTAAFGSRAFSVEEAGALGISWDQLRRGVLDREVQRVRRGIYAVPAEVPSPLLQAQAAVAELSGAAVSYETAAQMHGLPIPLGRGKIAHVTDPGMRSRSAQSVRVHVSALPDHHVTLLGGVRVTSLERTAIDIARVSRLPEALICMDAVCREIIRRAKPPDMDIRDAVLDDALRGEAQRALVRILRDIRGWPGVIRARRAFGLAEPAAESPLESESRGAILLEGVLPPECGRRVEGADGEQFWADMLWRKQRVIGECDGTGKYDEPGSLYKEKLRQESLEQGGHTVVRWGYPDVRPSAHRLAYRIKRALSKVW